VHGGLADGGRTDKRSTRRRSQGCCAQRAQTVVAKSALRTYRCPETTPYATIRLPMSRPQLMMKFCAPHAKAKYGPARGRAHLDHVEEVEAGHDLCAESQATSSPPKARAGAPGTLSFDSPASPGDTYGAVESRDLSCTRPGIPLALVMLGGKVFDGLPVQQRVCGHTKPSLRAPSFPSLTSVDAAAELCETVVSEIQATAMEGQRTLSLSFMALHTRQPPD
jgi:hypothetical protein